jgi:hypothetical protein
MPSPTLSNNFTNDGSGAGSYTTVLSNLKPSTIYYVRAFATNDLGTSYGNVLYFSTNAPAIGISYAGGIVFYVDGTGQHGLVCATSDQGSYEWGCYGQNLFGNFSNFVGFGQSNTNLIVNGCGTRPIAASVCSDLALDGYDDWFLPSPDELSLMYSNLRTQGIGNFNNTQYWSSSQHGADKAWSLNMPTGDLRNNENKGVQFKVRAVRAF